MVRTGSARHQEPLVLGGHERSCSANKNRRSQGIHRFDLGRHNSLGPGSSPPSDTPFSTVKPDSAAELDGTLTQPSPLRVHLADSGLDFAPLDLVELRVEGVQLLVEPTQQIELLPVG
jgi:hypothetical protein